MAFNYIWIGFFIVAFAVALIKFIVFQDTEVFLTLVNSLFEYAKSGFEFSIGLTGVLAFWLGIMKIGERAGVTTILSRVINPFFTKIFPDLPKDSPAFGTMVMNFASNMLGLDNAATPLGLKAMQELQSVNKDKSKASNPMIMFLVLNTSGMTLIPISVILYRMQEGAANPTDVFLPILLATFFATIAGFMAVAIKQKINIMHRLVITVLCSLLAFILLLFWGLSFLSQVELQAVSLLSSSIILISIIVSFFIMGIRKKINIYDAFIDGSKEGFSVAIRIIPYLIAILVAIGVFRASGAMDLLLDGIKALFSYAQMNLKFIDALPTAIMKPLSGNGARGMMLDAMKTYGPDSFVGRLSSVFQGTTDTTFYIIAVYFGSVGIKNSRYALSYGLFADFVGVISAILITYFFFG